MALIRILSIIILISIFACSKNKEKIYQGHLTEEPVNLEDFNSPYDDYNSAAPTLGYLIPFCFSTNRNSQGDHFDIAYYPMNITFQKSTGILTVTREYAQWAIYRDMYNLITNALEKVNTRANEFGPYLLFHQNYNLPDSSFVLLYATNEKGNFDIRFTFNEMEREFHKSNSLDFINTDFDELYPTFNTDFSQIFFCSNREDDIFNIYKAPLSNTTDIVEKITHTSPGETNKIAELSSTSDDKCPYIFDNLMVFSSNREGGYGGFDLYYSRFENGTWSEPINFGSVINSEYDEYRPIIFEEGVSHSQYMMVFSSDRPGGLGGFDLYFAGIDKDL